MKNLDWDTNLYAETQKEISIGENKKTSIVAWFGKVFSYIVNFTVNAVVSLGVACILYLTAIILIILFQFVAVVLSIVILLILFLLLCLMISYIVAPEWTVKKTKKIF